MRRNNNFDFLRFIFAYIVVVAHAIVLSKSTTLDILKPYFDSRIAVSGFFIISGCLIANSFINTPTFKAYIKKRALRLLPNYIFVIVACLIGFSFISILPLKEYFTSPVLYKYLLANLSFQNYIQPSLPGVFEGSKYLMSSVNGSLWTIKVEVLFYLTIPLVIYLIGKKINQNSRKKIFWFISIYVLSVIYSTFFEYLASIGHPSSLGNQLPAFMSYFMSGLFILYYSDFIEKTKRILIPAAIIVFTFEYYFGLHYLLPIAMAIIVYAIAFNFKFLNNFGKYGDFSYGSYIYHFPIIQLYVYLGLFESFNHWIALLIVLATTFTLSVLSWNFIEKPFLRKK